MNENLPWDNHEANTPKEWTNSLLQDIITAAKNQPSSWELIPKNNTPETPKKVREPISMALFLKLIGSLLFVAIIFFGSFLAYIAFNPAEAVFFTNTFNIDPNDVQNILKKLINGSFGFIMIIISVAWIISLFRAFWVPKDLKRKRLLSWLYAGVIGLILFMILAFWWYIFRIVGATDYSNPDGAVLIYDQTLYTREEYKDQSRLYKTSNLIGPIDIFFDIRSNAESLAKENLYTIDSFEINFDGARCTNGRSTITGRDPMNEQSIVCTFDTVKPYNLTGEYKVRGRDGTNKAIPIVLPSIEISGIVDIKNQENSRGKKIITLDASALKKLWTPRWIYQNGKEITESIITETVSSVSQAVCLRVYENTSCDRVFLLENTNENIADGTIESIEDPSLANAFHFSLSGITLNANQIIDIEWILDNQNIICQDNDEVCDYTFSNYWQKNIRATITTANGKKYSFEKEITVNEPIALVRHVKVFNTDGVLLNDENTYDTSLRAYILRNSIIPPETLTFDARDIVSTNAGFQIDKVLWKITNSKTSEEKIGEKITVDFNQPLRYTVEAFYLFKKEVPGGISLEETAKETIIIDIERKSLMPRMNVTMSSDYIPSTVSIDASQSESENGEIKKFIFDFGEWRTPAEWDAIQQYMYTKPGEKTITLTIVWENGEKASLKKTIVFKDEVKTIDFMPSITPGTVGNAVDFEALWTNGQIEEYIWTFGDNTPVDRGYQVSHTYEKAGTYTLTLTIRYTDGTIQSKKKTFEVTE